jgi:sigma-E factor negative regulatory protein RseC
MIEAEAEVVAVRAGQAEVRTLRQSSCGSCAAKSGCGTSLIAAWFPQRELRFLLANDIGASPGDRVVVGLEEGRLQRGSLLLYAVPLAGLLGGALAGDGLLQRLRAETELGAILGGLLGLFGALWFVRRQARAAAPAGQDDVRLLRVVPNQPGLRVQVPAALSRNDKQGTDTAR